MNTTTSIMQRIRNRVINDGIIEADDRVDLVYLLYLDDTLDTSDLNINPAVYAAKISDAIEEGCRLGQLALEFYGEDRKGFVLLHVPEKEYEVSWKSYMLDACSPALFKHLSSDQFKRFIGVD